MTEPPDPSAPAPSVTSTSVAPPAPPAAVLPAARRPGLDPATRRQTLIVAAVLAVLFYGTQILNEAIPARAQDQAPVGAAIAIGDGARITPLAGWVSSPHKNGPGIRLEKGVVVIDLYPETSGGNAGALAAAYLEQVLKPDSTQLTTTETEIARAANGSAARFTYQGIFTGVDVELEGEVTAVFIDGQGVVADAWSRQGNLAGLLAEVHATLDTIEVAP